MATPEQRDPQQGAARARPIGPYSRADKIAAGAIPNPLALAAALARALNELGLPQVSADPIRPDVGTQAFRSVTEATRNAKHGSMTIFDKDGMLHPRSLAMSAAMAGLNLMAPPAAGFLIGKGTKAAGFALGGNKQSDTDAAEVADQGLPGGSLASALPGYDLDGTRGVPPASAAAPVAPPVPARRPAGPARGNVNPNAKSDSQLLKEADIAAYERGGPGSGTGGPSSARNFRQGLGRDSYGFGQASANEVGAGSLGGSGRGGVNRESGGAVPGLRGQPSPVTAHGDEHIITTEAVDLFGRETFEWMNRLATGRPEEDDAPAFTADDVRSFFANTLFSPRAPSDAAPAPGPRLQPGQRAKNAEGDVIELAEDGQWHYVNRALRGPDEETFPLGARPSESILGQLFGVTTDRETGQRYFSKRDSLVPGVDPGAMVAKGVRDALVGLTTLPFDLFGAGETADAIGKVVPQVQTQGLVDDVGAALVQFGIPGGAAYKTARGALAASKVGTAGQVAGGAAAAGLSDAAVSDPRSQASLSETLGVVDEIESPLARRGAIGLEGGGLTAAVDAAISGIARGLARARNSGPGTDVVVGRGDGLPPPDGGPSFGFEGSDAAKARQARSEAAGQRYAKQTEEDILREFTERQQREQAGQQGAGTDGFNRQGAEAKYQTGERRWTNQAQDFDAEAGFPIDEFGFVLSTKGGPVIFGDPKQAARWIVNVGDAAGGRQLFELAVHPSFGGAGRTVYTVRVRGQRAAEGGAPGGAADDAATAAPSAARTDTTGPATAPGAAGQRGRVADDVAPSVTGEARSRSGPVVDAEARGLADPWGELEKRVQALEQGQPATPSAPRPAPAEPPVQSLDDQFSAVVTPTPRPDVQLDQTADLPSTVRTRGGTPIRRIAPDIAPKPQSRIISDDPRARMEPEAERPQEPPAPTRPDDDLEIPDFLQRNPRKPKVSSSEPEPSTPAGRTEPEAPAPRQGLPDREAAELGPPGPADPKAGKLRGTPRTPEALERGLDRADARRNRPTLDRDQRAAAEAARTRTTDEVRRLAEGDVAQWQKRANEARESGADRVAHTSQTGKPLKRPSDATRTGAQRYQEAWDERMAGAEKPSRSGPNSRRGFDEADEWLNQNPRPEGPETADFTLRTARGQETKFSARNDADVLDRLGKDFTAKPSTTFYSNPFANPALVRESAPEVIGALVGGVYGEWLENGEIGFSMKWAMAGALGLSAAMRLPIKGKTAFGPKSHASDALKKFPDAVLKGRPVLRHFHPTNGIADELWDKVQMTRVATRNWQTDAARLAKSVRDNFTQAERALMSDWIEKIDFPSADGKVNAGGFAAAEKRVKDQAEELSRWVEDLGQRLVDAGMLDRASFDALRGQYLHRYYAGRVQQGKSWFGQRESINGSWGKRRGETRLVTQPTGKRTPNIGDKITEMRNPSNGQVRFAQASEINGLRGRGFVETKVWKVDHLTGDQMALWRDYSPFERRAMGEIRDASYRFLRGSMEASHDLALGQLFGELAADARWARAANAASIPDGWVQVPTSVVPGTRISKYGKLSGMWVDPEVMTALKVVRKPWTNSDSKAMNDAVNAYLKVLGAWKVGKTAYNPATHFRNVMANVTLSQLAGDIGAKDLAQAFTALRRNASVVEEARRAGLSIDTEINLGDEVRAIERELLSGSPNEHTFAARALQLFLDNKVTQTYQHEDSIFKLASYMKQRAAGKSEREAVQHAHSLYFDYGDVPLGVQAVRDSYAPFFSYQYKVAPVLAKIAAEKPHRVVAAFGILSGMSIASYGLLYPQAPKGREDYERELLPRWLKGTGPFGAPRSIRLPFNKDDAASRGEDRALWFNSRYMLPGGDLLDITNNTEFGPSIWPQAVGGTPLGGNPFVQTIYGVLSGNDPFFDKDFLPYPETDYFDPDAPGWQKAENVKALARWLSYQWAPPTMTWTVDKLGNAAVGSGLIDEDNGLAQYMEWTGTDFAGRQLSIEQALLQVIGLKADDVNPDEQERFRAFDHRMKVRDANTNLRRSHRNKRFGGFEQWRRERALDEAIDDASRDQALIRDLKEKARAP